MARPLGWRELIPGLLMFGALIVLSVAIFLFARIGALHGKTERLYVATSETRGILKGTEVWLAGQKVGLVADVSFRPPTTDTTDRMVVALDILTQYRSQIRGDSRAQIRSGGSMIGAQVVWVTPGSALAPVLASGDTIPSIKQNDTEELTSRMAGAGAEFPAIIANIATIGAQLSSARGTLGAVGSERTGLELDALRSHASQLMAAAGARGAGTGVLGHRAELTARAQHVLAAADSLRQMLASGRGTYGRFRRDSSLTRTVDDLRNEAAIVGAELARSEGTAGRVQHDMAIEQALTAAQTGLDSLFADMRRHPLHYISF